MKTHAKVERKNIDQEVAGLITLSIAQKNQPEELNKLLHKTVSASKTNLQEWQTRYTHIPSACIRIGKYGQNMIGQVIDIQGWVTGDPSAKITGIVLSSTATTWERSEKDDNPERHLVLHSDGSLHWVDLSGDKFSWSFSKI